MTVQLSAESERRLTKLAAAGNYKSLDAAVAEMLVQAERQMSFGEFGKDA